jgi:GT2 family glycosyltransferase
VLGYLSRKLDTRGWRLSNLVSFDYDHDTRSTTTRLEPKVSIIIPTRDKPKLLRACIESIRENTNYSNYELFIVDNSSIEPETKDLLAQFESEGVSILKYPGVFNYSAICNFAATKATGEYLCFLNNDTEAISGNWLKSMVEHASRGNTGLVGALLSYPNGSIQHMGIALGHTGIAGHPYRGESKDQCVPETCFEVSAVTFACAMISASKFWEIGALDESFPSGFNDVDVSIRSTNHKYKNILCVKAKLIHRESQTRPQTLSLLGFSRAITDVFTILRKHRGGLKETFFAAGTFSRTRHDPQRGPLTKPTKYQNEE